MKRNKLPNNTQQYIQEQKKQNLKDKDKVIIIRTAESYKNGWYNNWTPKMTKFVGQTGTVITRLEDYGVCVEFPGPHIAYFPYFVLRKVQ